MGRQYTWRWRCPKCGRPYAKRTLWATHAKTCADPYSARWERVKVGYSHIWRPTA